MIQSEFGWSDKRLLRLPICRVRQIIEIITQRKTEEARMQARIVEWQTKHIAIALSVLSQSKEQSKAMNKLVKQMKLPLADEEDSRDTRSMEEIIEQGAIVDLDEQPDFESLSALFGGSGNM